jgi:hypothetical protein
MTALRAAGLGGAGIFGSGGAASSSGIAGAMAGVQSMQQGMGGIGGFNTGAGTDMYAGAGNPLAGLNIANDSTWNGSLIANGLVSAQEAMMEAQSFVSSIPPEAYTDGTGIAGMTGAEGGAGMGGGSPLNETLGVISSVMKDAKSQGLFEGVKQASATTGGGAAAGAEAPPVPARKPIKNIATEAAIAEAGQKKKPAAAPKANGADGTMGAEVIDV